MGDRLKECPEDDVLNKLPKSMQPRRDLREIKQEVIRTMTETAMDFFAEKYGTKHETPVTCLAKDREASLALYGPPTVLAPNCAVTSLTRLARRGASSSRCTGAICAGETRPSVLGAYARACGAGPSVATVRHQTVRTKGVCRRRRRSASFSNAFQPGAKTWRRLRGREPIALVIRGVTVTNDVARNTPPGNRAARSGPVTQETAWHWSTERRGAGATHHLAEMGRNPGVEKLAYSPWFVRISPCAQRSVYLDSAHVVARSSIG